MNKGWLHFVRLIFPFFSSFGLFSSAMAVDLKELKQDHTFYLKKSSAEQELVNPLLLGRLNENFNQHFFSPWHLAEPRGEKEEALLRFKRYPVNSGYGENRKKHSREWIEKLAATDNLEAYPNAGFKATTIAKTIYLFLPPILSSVGERGTMRKGVADEFKRK